MGNGRARSRRKSGAGKVELRQECRGIGKNGIAHSNRISEFSQP
jgi:hypothetical protein